MQLYCGRNTSKIEQIILKYFVGTFERKFYFFQHYGALNSSLCITISRRF